MTAADKSAADEAIAEIRAVRHRISAEHGHDVRKYLEHLKELEERYKEQIEAYRRMRKPEPPSTAQPETANH